MANFKIIRFTPETGQITVEFDPKMSPLSVDVPLDSNGNFIVGEELNNYIIGFIPTEYIQRLDKIKNGIPNADEIASLVVPPTSIEDIVTNEEYIQAQNASLEMWREVFTDKVIAKALVKFGVLQSDPTEIPVSAQ